MNNPALTAHWPLRGSAQDIADGHPGTDFNLAYGEGPDGSSGSAALFNGRDSAIRVSDAESLRLGNRDFSISVWVRPERPMRGVFGDILSKFDGERRCGLNLGVAGSSPAYNAMSDARHVHFGIDDGHVSAWEDCGRPWRGSSHVSCLITYEGELYGGIADAPDPMEAARVFRWAGGREWIDCGRLGADPNHLSVQSMIVHDGRLYAGTGVWDWVRAKMGEGFRPAPTRVFVYSGGTEWQDLGQVGNGARVMCLGSFDGDLYAGLDSGPGGGRCFRHDGSVWADCGAPDGRNLECLLPHGGALYAATHGNVYRYEGGQSWACIGREPHGINQIHSMQVVGGALLIGTWPQGYVLRREGDGWAIAGRLGLPEGMRECNEVMDLTVYNGKLYAGVIPKAQVYRYEADGRWTLMASLASRPDWAEEDSPTWCRVTSLTAFRGRLLASTGACRGRAVDLDPDETLGRVLAFQAGQVVSHERDIGGGWTHLAAIRRGKGLHLYVNGRLSASSQAAGGRTFHLANTQPLHIGLGAQGHFSGAMSDLRLYAGALSDAQVGELCARRGR